MPPLRRRAGVTLVSLLGTLGSLACLPACSSGASGPPLRSLPGLRVLPREQTPRTGFSVLPPGAGPSASKMGYSGLLTAPGLEALKTAYKDGVTTLLVRSQGGDPQVGMAFGEWIRAHGMDVTVVDYCASSCANYVFTAGWHKTILPKSIVAWQGNHRTKRAEDEASREHTGEALQEMRAEEDLFFKRLGVSECVCRVGNEAALGDLAAASAKAPRFFTLSPQDMARFGVDNVEGSNENEEDVNPAVWKWLRPRAVNIPRGTDASGLCGTP